MPRSRKIALVVAPVAVLIVVVVVGYFARRTIQQGRRAVAANSTLAADSAAVSADTTAGPSKKSEDKSRKKRKKGKDEKDREADPVPVEVASVTLREISSYYYTTANLEPEKSVNILAKIAGEISKLYLEEGDVVREGALICELLDDEPRITLDEARINLDKQRREFERLRSMHEQKLISDKEFSDAKYQYELTETKYEAAKLKYDYTKIRAPFGGVITKRYVNKGATVNVGSQLFEIVDPDPLLVRMYLPENEVYHVRTGQEVYITPDNDPGVTLNGKVVLIAPEVDTKTGTVKVTAETRGGAMPGSFARVRIVTDTHKGSLAIPRRSLVPDAGEMNVFVAEADTVRKIPVKIGYQDERFAEVLDGLNGGDKVVVVGMGGLRTGTKVKLLETDMHEELSKQSDKK